MTIDVRGTAVLIDEQDSALCASLVLWIDSKGYVACRSGGHRSRLHRVLLGSPVNRFVDHRNRNKLDNRRANLRVATRNENARNSKHRKHNTSGYRGVYYCRQTGRWRAEIRVNARGVKLGRFDDCVTAALAYDAAAIKLHGDFAVLNFGPGCGGEA